MSSSPPLTGSYITSLLSGRIASSNSHATTFNLHLSACASLEDDKPTPSKPKPLQMAFQAIWNDVTGPYTATVDISEYLRGHITASGTGESAEPITSDPDPGDYPLPSLKGQVQLIITNEMGTLIKMFIIPYDFTSIRKSGIQVIRRQVWCTRVKSYPQVPGDLNCEQNEAPISSKGQDTIRYAAQLHFVCRTHRSPRHVPRTSDLSSEALLRRLEQVALSTEAPMSVFPVDMDLEGVRSTQSQPSPVVLAVSAPPSKAKRTYTSVRRTYLTGTVRLVFNSRPPEDDEELVMTTDTMDIFA